MTDSPDGENTLITAIPGTGENSGKWHFSVKGYSLNLSGETFNAASGSNPTTWLNLVEKSSLSDDDFVNIKQHRFLLDGKMVESDWLLPEISEDMSGHYILNLNAAEFEERLARFDKLGLEEKMRLLIDRDLLSKTELVESESLVPLLLKFKEEESPAVWTIIATVVSGLKIFFETGSEAEKCFKKYVKDLVKPGLEKIGITGRNTDDAD